jgi:hypothetical protein
MTQQRLWVSTAGWLASVLVGQDVPVGDVGLAVVAGVEPVLSRCRWWLPLEASRGAVAVWLAK